MNRAEAIKHLEEWVEVISIPSRKKAINMAIESLQDDWTPVSEGFPEEREWGYGYVEPSDYVLVYGRCGNYGVSRYWGNRLSRKESPYRYPDWLDLDWVGDDVIAWRPLPEPYKKED